MPGRDNLHSGNGSDNKQIMNPEETKKEEEVIQTPPEEVKSEPGAISEQPEPQKSGESVERDGTGKFLPGHGKVPGSGAKQGSRYTATLMREYLKTVAKTKSGEELPLDEAIIRRQVQKALDGHDKSAEMIWDRLDGKPVVRAAITDSEGNDIITPERKTLIDKALEQIIQPKPNDSTGNPIQQ